MSKKSKYIFELFAPYNKKANLLADFNEWKPRAMKKSADGFFRLPVQIADGIYEYRFEIQTKSWFYEENEWKTVTDPYATEVDGATQNAVLRIKNGEKIVDEYEWRHEETRLPENSAVIIYELHVGDFSGGEPDKNSRGRYTDASDKLDYLENLGVNAIELMPVKESPGDFSWGYSPMHFFAVEENYGASFELKEFIDKCHAQNTRVFIDGVYNHANSEMPLTQIDHDYWFRHEPKDPENNWGPEFDYEFHDEKLDLMPARKFVFDTIRFWLSEYRLDGIRFDGVRQIGNDALMEDFNRFTHELIRHKPFINIAEHIPSTPEIVKPRGAMDACWNDAFMYGVREHLTGEIFDLKKLKEAIDPGLLGYEFPDSIVNYLCNHDHNRLMKHLADRDIFGAEAFRRAEIGATLLLTAVGIPMIWMGEEFGEFREKSQKSNKINWKLLENKENQKLFEHYKSLIHLRRRNRSLQSANADFFHEDEQNKVLAFRRFTDGAEESVVIINLSNAEFENYEIENFPNGEIWLDFLKNQKLEIYENKFAGRLEPFSAKIFIRKDNL